MNFRLVSQEGPPPTLKHKKVILKSFVCKELIILVSRKELMQKSGFFAT